MQVCVTSWDRWWCYWYSIKETNLKGQLTGQRIPLQSWSSRSASLSSTPGPAAGPSSTPAPRQLEHHRSSPPVSPSCSCLETLRTGSCLSSCSVKACSMYCDTAEWLRATERFKSNSMDSSGGLCEALLLGGFLLLEPTTQSPENKAVPLRLNTDVYGDFLRGCCAIFPPGRRSFAWPVLRRTLTLPFLAGTISDWLFHWWTVSLRWRLGSALYATHFVLSSGNTCNKDSFNAVLFHIKDASPVFLKII